MQHTLTMSHTISARKVDEHVIRISGWLKKDGITLVGATLNNHGNLIYEFASGEDLLAFKLSYE